MSSVFKTSYLIFNPLVEMSLTPEFELMSPWAFVTLNPGYVAQVQQQIQVLAAEQRSIEEQSRGLGSRRERLGADRNALAAPDEVRLQNLQDQREDAQEAAEVGVAIVKDSAVFEFVQLDHLTKTYIKTNMAKKLK